MESKQTNILHDKKTKGYVLKKEKRKKRETNEYE